MFDITGDQEQVLKLMQQTIRTLAEDKPATKKAGTRSLSIKSATKWSAERDQILDALKRGYDNEQPKKTAKAASLTVPQERAVESWYAPRNRTVALFQSAMDEFLEAKNPDQTPPGKTKNLSLTKKAVASKHATMADFYTGGSKKMSVGKRTAKRIKATSVKAAEIVQFSNLDPRWAEVVWEKAKLLFKGKHKFTTHKSYSDFRFPMKDKTTIAIVGDWGGGNKDAQAVAQLITKMKPDHVIHLGDVYYAGTEKEIKNRFLQYWPTPPAGGMSFALNSNHEMYSGGYGYFDVTLKQFKQPASYFSLSNNNWRLIGLDTGYVDHDLNKEQADWLMGQFKGTNPKTILLSHHQLFSAYEDTDASNLQSRVQPLLDAGKVFGWIWGHEHLCVVYQPHMGINAVCLGNGCFPYNPPKNDPNVPVRWMNNRSLTGSSDFKGIHTFALLSIDGNKIEIQYFDQDGVNGFNDTWK